MKLIENIKELIDKLNQNKDVKKELNSLYEIDQKKAWQRIEMICGRERRVVRRLFVMTTSVAAAMLFFYLGVRNESYSEKQLTTQNKIARIDYGKAYIMTSGGEKIQLLSDTMKEGIAKFQKSMRFVKCVAPVRGDLHALNTIVVPKGETLKVELSDGTIVWLNSDSRLVYPATFVKERREVQLSGEGYFEVVSDAKTPFIVKGNDFDVRVTGTKFNVSDYKNENNTQVTLLEGIVAVKIGAEVSHLTPSEQFNYNKETKKITKTTVDPLLYTSWTKDKIFLKDISLENIAVILDRWYGIRLEYKNAEIAKETFSGEIYRCDTPEDIVNFITKAANLKWETNDKGSVIIY